MQFSDTTSYNGIIQEIEKYTDLGLGSISGDTTRLKQFTVDINNESNIIWHDIFSVSNGWLYDDGQNTNLPQAYTSIVSGTFKYALPSEALTIERIEVKDVGGNWKLLSPYSLSDTDRAVGDLNDDQGSPTCYRMIGNTIELYPVPNYSATDGLKVFFKRGTVAFTSTDTTDVPGFASVYHQVIPLGVSIRWLKIKQPQSPTLPQLEKDYFMIREQIRDFYANRFGNYNPPSIKTKSYDFE